MRIGVAERSGAETILIGAAERQLTFGVRVGKRIRVAVADFLRIMRLIGAPCQTGYCRSWPLSEKGAVCGHTAYRDHGPVVL